MFFLSLPLFLSDVIFKLKDGSNEMFSISRWDFPTFNFLFVPKTSLYYQCTIFVFLNISVEIPKEFHLHNENISFNLHPSANAIQCFHTQALPMIHRALKEVRVRGSLGSLK